MTEGSKILMVCLGNICRSPMAEGIFRHDARTNGIEIFLDSAGTSGHHSGEAPDRRAIACLAEKGIDISGLRARRFSASDFDSFDHIFVMDHSNMRDVLSQSRSEADRAKVRYFLEVLPGKQPRYVPDPWYGDASGFEDVFDMLSEATRLHLSSMRSADETR